MGQILPFRAYRRGSSRQRGRSGRWQRLWRTALDLRFALLVAVGAFVVVSLALREGAYTLWGKTSGVAVQSAFTLCSEGTRITCVIDGDTIRYGGEKIRLADINTPETAEAQCQSEAVLGERAKLRLLGWVNAGPFEIRVVNTNDRDRYGRLLRILVRDGRSVGDLLVAEGLAERWTGQRRNWC